MIIQLPYSTKGMNLELAEDLDVEILESAIASMPKPEKTEDELVLEAMANPIGSPKLSELAMAKEMGFEVAADVNEALNMALEMTGRDAHIAVIPDGVSVMIR